MFFFVFLLKINEFLTPILYKPLDPAKILLTISKHFYRVYSGCKAVSNIESVMIIAY